MRYTPILVAAVASLSVTGVATADKVGVAVDAATLVQDIANGPTRVIVAKSEIFSDDRLKANASGNAQIELVDHTKIIVGPNADIRIDDFVYTGGNTIQHLTLKATKGALRFISGNSSHSAYNIETPQGSIGVRGTAIDISVGGGRTNVALLEGAMRVCDRGGQCRVVDDPCQFVSIGGGVSREKRLDTKEGKSEAAGLFPLLANQGSLRPQFRRNARGCSPTIFDKRETAVAQVEAAPEPEPPAAEPPAVEGPGNPGNGKGVGDAGEQPGNGGFGIDGTNGKGQNK